MKALAAAGADLNIQDEVSPMGTLFFFVVLLFVSKQRVCVGARARVCVYVCFFPLQSTTVIIMIMLILITMLFLFLSNLFFIIIFLLFSILMAVFLIFQGCYDDDDGNEIIVLIMNTTL